MSRRWLMMAALGLTMVTLGCAFRDRPRLFGRFRGQNAMPYHDPYTHGSMPCGCEGGMFPSGGVIMPGGASDGIQLIPGTNTVPPLTNPTPPANVPPDQARPMPADPSKGTETSRPKMKTIPF